MRTAIQKEEASLMSLYEGIKDAAKIVQKADNIELYQKLLDLSSQALDLQAQIQKLT